MDQERLGFLGINCRQGQDYLQWFSSEAINDTWQPGEPAGAPFDYADYDIGAWHMTTAPLRAIYFSSARCQPDQTDTPCGNCVTDPGPCSVGGEDLWVTIFDTGTYQWRSPINLGDEINTVGDENHPFVSLKNELWYSGPSGDQPGYGGIYRYDLNPWSCTPPQEVIARFAGDPALDADGNIYFTHHFFDSESGLFLESDVYVAKRKPVAVLEGDVTWTVGVKTRLIPALVSIEKCDPTCQGTNVSECSTYGGTQGTHYTCEGLSIGSTYELTAVAVGDTNTYLWNGVGTGASLSGTETVEIQNGVQSRDIEMSCEECNLDCPDWTANNVSQTRQDSLLETVPPDGPYKMVPNVGQQELPGCLFEIEAKDSPPILNPAYEDFWYDPVPLDWDENDQTEFGNVNTAAHEDSAFILPDGNTLYFYFNPTFKLDNWFLRFHPAQGIYRSVKQNGIWGTPTQVVLANTANLEGALFVNEDQDLLIYGNTTACPPPNSHDPWYGAVQDPQGNWSLGQWIDPDASPLKYPFNDSDYAIDQFHMTFDEWGNPESIFYQSKRCQVSGGTCDPQLCQGICSEGGI
jgi:hypothetical protein